MQFSRDHIFTDEDTASDLMRLQLILTRRALKRLILTILLVVGSLPMIIVGPTYAFIYKHAFSIPTGIILPFVDPNTSKGFSINALLQSGVSVVGCLAMIRQEGCVSLVDSTIYSMKELTKYQLSKFNENILNGKYDHESELKNILIMLEDIQEYVGRFNDILYYKAFIQPTLTAVCAGVSILCQYAVS